MPRSLFVCLVCFGFVKLAVRRNGFPSQQALAEDLGLARSTVVNFLVGKPVDRAVFEEICEKLSLDSKEVAELDFETPSISGKKTQMEFTRSYGDLREATDVSAFHGRREELATLEHLILQEPCRLIALLGDGGIGNTALSVKLANQVKDQFEYVIWRSLRNAPPLEEILTELIQFLAPKQEGSLPETSDGLVSRLLDHLRQHRCLVILDNYESILQEGVHAGEYRSGYESYSHLLRCIGEVHHKSCVVLTSREKPSEVVQMEGSSLPVRSLRLSGLGELEGYKIFETKGYSGSEAELKPLIERYSGNPLALKVIATTVQELFDNNVAEFLQQETIIFGDIWKLLGEQFGRLSVVEAQVMYWLAIEREWVAVLELRENIFPPVAQRKLIEAIESLQRRSLIEKRSSSFTQQPVIMEYMTNRLIEQVLQEIKTGQISLLSSFALLKAQSKDYVRESQVRLIFNPLIKGLQEYFRTEINIRHCLDALLQKIHSEHELKLGYATGNLLNLYRYLKLNFAGYDFSGLVIRQAFLQEMDLHDVNFSYSEFIHPLFTQTFGGILSVRFSPDGQTLASGSTNCEIQLWRVADRQRLLSLQGHSNWVRCIAFSPDGKFLVSSSDDGTLRIWQLPEGTCKKILRGHVGSVYGAAFSPDGQFIASTSNDSSIRLWNVDDGNCIRLFEGHTSGTLSINFSPCGKLLASSSFDNTVRLWDVNSGTCLHTITEHSNWVTGLSFSPDGQWLASPSCVRTIRIWRVADWHCVRILEGHTGWVWGTAWSPDSHLIASCSTDCTAKLWDITTGNCLRTLGGHTIQVWRVAFSPDGQTIATGGEDQTIGLWDVESGRRIATMIGYTNWVRSAAFSPDGKVMATGHKDKTLRIWDDSGSECLQELRTHSSGISSLAFHPHSEWIASGGLDSIIKIWDWQRGEWVAVFKGHSSEVWGLAFSPDGRLLASSSFDQTIRLWSLEDRTCLTTLVGHSDRVPTIAFHPSGEVLASGSDDCTIKLWNIAEEKCYATLTGHGARVGTVAFSPDGNRLVSASLDQTLKIWDVPTGECLQILQGHTNWVMGAAFFPDSHTVASAGCDRVIKIWDSDTGVCLNTLIGHTNWVWAIAISPDGQRLVSASEDGLAKLWDAGTGNCLSVLEHRKPYQGMRITGVMGLTPAQEETLRQLGAKLN